MIAKLQHQMSLVFLFINILALGAALMVVLAALGPTTLNRVDTHTPKYATTFTNTYNQES